MDANIFIQLTYLLSFGIFALLILMFLYTIIFTNSDPIIEMLKKSVKRPRNRR